MDRSDEVSVCSIRALALATPVTLSSPSYYKFTPYTLQFWKSGHKMQITPDDDVQIDLQGGLV